MKDEKNYSITKMQILHHYLLTTIFFIIALLLISIYGHTVKEITKIQWSFSLVYFVCFGFAVIFTNRIYSRLKIKYKYVFIGIVLIASALPLIFVKLIA